MPTERDYARSIEDNYPTYVRDTFGYQYDGLDVLNPVGRAAHDRLRVMPPEALAGLDLAALDGIELLAVAHAWLDHGRAGEAARVLEEILGRETFHTSVAMDEVLEHAALLRAEGEEFEQARALLAGAAWASDWTRKPLIEGIVEHAAGRDAESRAHLDAYVDADEEDAAERCYEIAEFMVASVARGKALSWLERARAHAPSRSLQADIDLLERALSAERDVVREEE